MEAGMFPADDLHQLVTEYPAGSTSAASTGLRFGPAAASAHRRTLPARRLKTRFSLRLSNKMELQFST
ncbi:hypothetical protein EJB05_28707 [Eragrostis curvula]|uniref:Uncharacterized protein n=1 Tax=Eragrostis curvula TaxID=38414 RepID=A0A5J9USB1_9POAL|nr:hypothetical protein EJB05_28707 [Eragrostis curvula]